MEVGFAPFWQTCSDMVEWEGGNFKMADSQLQNAFIEGNIEGDLEGFFVQSEEYPL